MYKSRATNGCQKKKNHKRDFDNFRNNFQKNRQVTN